MDWTNETVMKFLELYRMHPCIWDPKNPCHRKKSKLSDAWIDIKNNLGIPCTIKEMKKKKESLMSAYRGYRTKIKKSETSGTGTPHVYKPTWYAYSFMDSFLGDIYQYTPRSEDYQNEQDAADYNNYSNESSDDTDDITTEETDPLNHQQKPVSNTLLRNDYTNHERTYSQKISIANKSKRRHNYPSDMHQSQKHMEQAFSILKTVSQQHHNEEEDECCIYGKLVATKMRKLSADRRDLMMIKINQLFYNESHEQQRSNSSASIDSYAYASVPIKTEIE